MRVECGLLEEDRLFIFAKGSMRVTLHHAVSS